MNMLYQKSLRINQATKGALGVGKIVNLQSNDAAKLWGLAQYLHILWSGPFQVRGVDAGIHELRWWRATPWKASALISSRRGVLSMSGAT